ncbi:MAG: aromatic ring-hydroxylating dioxygenase subunit alpha [Actinomycetota bacterium]|nr:aromatic ring-hydroxylating dioxygenase subunit alpha [Actinomycetota bacterium]
MTLRPEVLLHAAEVVGRMDDCMLPLADAAILPAEAYASELFHEFERDAIYRTQWLCVGHVAQVPDVGDVETLSIIGEPIMIVRGKDEQVRVLSAICQHRGHPLFDGLATPTEKVCRASRLTCPYHQWVYGLSGELLAAPEMHATTPLRQLKEEIRLPEIRTEIFHGLVFINFDDDAEPLAPTLAALDADLANYDTDDLVAMPAIDRPGLGWNWKVHLENALEPYHTAYVHKGSHEEAPLSNASFLPFEPGQGMIWHPTSLLNEDVSLSGGESTVSSPRFPRLTAEQRSRVMFSAIPPTLFLIQNPTMLDATILLPNGAGSLDHRRINLFPRAALDEPGFEEMYAALVARKDLVIAQDTATAEAAQRGYASSYAPRGRLSEYEETVHQLHEWLVPRYRAALEAATTPTPAPTPAGSRT